MLVSFDQNQGPVADINTRRPPEFRPETVKKWVIGIAIAIVVIFVGSTSFYTVQEQERAAIITLGKYTGESSAGLHFKFPYPFQQVHIVPAELTQRIHIGYRVNGNTETPVEDEAMMITGDENIVSADAVVQWKINNIRDYLFNISNAEEFLRNAASSSIRSVIGSQKLDYAITDGKTVIQDMVRERLVELQTKYQTGIQIIDIKFQDIEPPSGQVAEAFRAVTNAREEKNTKINNAAKYENDKLPKARGEAQALIENAEAQKKSRVLNAQGDVAQYNALLGEYRNNPDVTQSRLILETLERILPGAKIFITNSNSDTVNYLPLNELLRNNAGSGTSTQSTAPPATTPPAADNAEGGSAQ